MLESGFNKVIDNARRANTPKHNPSSVVLALCDSSLSALRGFLRERERRASACSCGHTHIYTQASATWVVRRAADRTQRPAPTRKSSALRTTPTIAAAADIAEHARAPASHSRTRPLRGHTHIFTYTALTITEYLSISRTCVSFALQDRVDAPKTLMMAGYVMLCYCHIYI